MKNIYIIIFFFTCQYSISQVEEYERKDRWQVVGSNSSGSVFLKLEGSSLYKLSFRNYQFSDKQIIENIYLNLSDLDISNFYSFLLKSFDLIVSEQSSFKIDKYEFQLSKHGKYIRVNINPINSNETIGWILFTIKDLNNLFGKY